MTECISEFDEFDEFRVADAGAAKSSGAALPSRRARRNDADGADTKRAECRYRIFRTAEETIAAFIRVVNIPFPGHHMGNTRYGESYERMRFP